MCTIPPTCKHGQFSSPGHKWLHITGIQTSDLLTTERTLNAVNNHDRNVYIFIIRVVLVTRTSWFVVMEGSYLNKHLALGAGLNGCAVHRHGLPVARKLQGEVLLHQLPDYLSKSKELRVKRTVSCVCVCVCLSLYECMMLLSFSAVLRGGVRMSLLWPPVKPRC